MIQTEEAKREENNGGVKDRHNKWCRKKEENNGRENDEERCGAAPMYLFRVT